MSIPAPISTARRSPTAPGYHVQGPPPIPFGTEEDDAAAPWGYDKYGNPVGDPGEVYNIPDLGLKSSRSATARTYDDDRVRNANKIGDGGSIITSPQSESIRRGHWFSWIFLFLYSS